MRVLGIDMGGTTLKSVLADAGRSKVTLLDRKEIPTVPSSSGSQAAQVRQIIDSLVSPPDRVVIAMRTSKLTYRNLFVPTKDRREIQNSIAFELEDDLPFDIEDAHFDWIPIPKSPTSTPEGLAQNGTHVHVTACLQSVLQAQLDEFASHGLDPDIITTEAWAYHASVQRALLPDEKSLPVLVINMGYDHAGLFAYHNGEPISFREISFGGALLTHAIGEVYGLTPDQAETAKIDNGFVLPPSQRGQATPDQQRFSDTLLNAMSELLREIRQMNLTIRNHTKQSTGIIFLSGGSCLVPGFDRYLEEELTTPIRIMPALKALGQAAATDRDEAVFGLAAALALTQTPAERGKCVQLRKGMFAKKGAASEMNLDRYKSPLRALGAVMACMILSLTVQGMYYQSKVDALNTQLEKSAQTFFPDATKNTIKAYISDRKKLKKEMENTLKQQRELAKLAGPNPTSPMKFLKDISQSIDRSYTLDMIGIQIGSAPTDAYSSDPTGTNAEITVLLPDAAGADKLAGVLERKLKPMTHSKPELDQASKKYKVLFTGKPMEATYGP